MVEPTCDNPAPFCPICAKIQAMVNEMDQARDRKDYEWADYIRKSLNELGVKVENTMGGTRWWRTR